LCIIWHCTVWCCSIGDSSMMVIDPADGVPLRVWQRGSQDDLQVCSYEDSLARFPYAIREGQTHRAVKDDYMQLVQLAEAAAPPDGPFVVLKLGQATKVTGTVRALGPSNGAIASHASLFRLGMTNTI
ncbi:hypothetical protein HK405_002138, partial [Cladochytrium tenue]